MYRILLIALIVSLPITAGCRRNSSTTTTSDPDDNMTTQQRVRRAVPAVGRVVGQNDLSQLQLYINQFHSENNRYPKSVDELGIAREAPHIAKAIQSGEIVLTGGKNGIIAYQKAALEERGSVITDQGIVTMTAAELRQKLGMSR